MSSAVYVLDAKGSSIISRNYRGDLPHGVISSFVRHVVDAEETECPPVFEENGYAFAFIRHNNLFFVAVTKINASPAMLLTYLYKLVDVLTGYLSVVTEESVRDNFVIIYELLDEMMDFGYPQYTEAKILKEYVMQESHKLLSSVFDKDEEHVKDLPSAVTGVGGATPWRQPGIKHSKNELFLDVIESVNFLVSPTGEVLHSEILGTLHMRCMLSGMPELKLGLNDKLQLGNATTHSTPSTTQAGKKSRSVDLEDVKFHPCVKLTRFDADRTISFIPPDGVFDLMQYRLSCRVRPLILIEAVFRAHSQTRVEFLVKAKSQFKRTSSATGVEIRIPVPRDVDTPRCKASTGSVRYSAEHDAIAWGIKVFPGGREYQCEGMFNIPTLRGSDGDGWKSRPVALTFEIPYFTVSGVQVRYVKVQEKSGYTAMPWVRYVTKSGEYHFRTVLM
eukprot:PhM_4_TR11811/c0_g1_i1/m.18545/K12393/AP1M; AP-1 complex subunit mu